MLYYDDEGIYPILGSSMCTWKLRNRAGDGVCAAQKRGKVEQSNYSCALLPVTWTICMEYWSWD